MAKPVLIIQLRPETLTSDNEYQSILKYCELKPEQSERLRAEQAGIPELDLNRYSAIIVGGSPFDITTPENEKSEIQVKIESDFRHLFDKVVTDDFPFLGACSGNGLLGSYLGAPLSRKYAEPVSLRTVTITEEGSRDPLLAGFPSEIDVLLGHKESCDEVPDGAVLLVTGEQCPIQMFRVKNNVYATQFHPEGDSEGFILRIHVYKNYGYFDPALADDMIEELSNIDTPYAQQILKRFADSYCR